jgi:hypothetical protein
VWDPFALESTYNPTLERSYEQQPALEHAYEEQEGYYIEGMGVEQEGYYNEGVGVEYAPTMVDFNHPRAKVAKSFFTEQPSLGTGSADEAEVGERKKAQAEEEVEEEEKKKEAEEKEAEDVEEVEEVEEGWIDSVEGDGSSSFVDRHSAIFELSNKSWKLAIFAPLDTLRMLIMGVCTAVLIRDPEAMTQAGTILGVHALQFALQLTVQPDAVMFDAFLNTFAMATDILPLIVAVVPVGNCGSLPVGTQMLLLAAALMATTQHIVVLMTDMIPRALTLGITLAVLMAKAIVKALSTVTRGERRRASGRSTIQ